MFASAAAALALSAAPAMADCAKTRTDAAAQAAGFQTIGYHAASTAKKPAKAATGDIIDVAVGAGSFNTLAAALTLSPASTISIRQRRPVRVSAIRQAPRRRALPRCSAARCRSAGPWPPRSAGV